MSEKWAPDPYMVTAVKFILSHGGAGILLDPGMCKTAISLAAFSVLQKEQKLKMLVIAPLRPCYLVWPAERAKWTDFENLKMEVLHGPKKNEALRRDADIYVINPAGLRWLFAELYKMRVWPFDVLCVDESTQFKHTNTEQFKTLLPYLGKFRRRWILTGTPAPNGLMDLFGQIKILDLGRALGQYITQYRNRYFLPTGFMGYQWAPQEDAEERIYRAIEPLTMRMDAKDYIKLPPIIGLNPPAVVSVRLPPAARKVYDNLEENLIAEVRGQVVKAANAAVASMKCRQVASGGIYTDAKERKWKLMHDEKTDAVEELLDELSGKPAIIAVDFAHDVARLKKRFDKTNKEAFKTFGGVPFIGGGVSMKETVCIEAAWNKGHLPFVLANTQSVAKGLNLQGAGRAVILHSITWNLEDYIQLVRRIWRKGQKHKVFLYHIVAQDTVDEVMMIALRSKAKTQADLLKALRAYAMVHYPVGRGRSIHAI